MNELMQNEKTIILELFERYRSLVRKWELTPSEAEAMLHFDCMSEPKQRNEIGINSFVGDEVVARMNILIGICDDLERMNLGSNLANLIRESSDLHQGRKIYELLIERPSSDRFMEVWKPLLIQKMKARFSD